jgi:hypothetical protein
MFAQQALLEREPAIPAIRDTVETRAKPAIRLTTILTPLLRCSALYAQIRCLTASRALFSIPAQIVMMATKVLRADNALPDSSTPTAAVLLTASTV